MPAPAYVQSASIGTATSVSSLTVPFTTDVGSGARLIIASSFWTRVTGTASLADITSITDTFGLSFANAVFNAGPVSWGLATWYAVAPYGGGPESITINYSGAWSLERFVITEVSGCDPSSPFDVGVGANGNSNSPNSGNVSTSAPNEFVYGFALSEGGAGAFTAGVNEAFTRREYLFPGNDAFTASEDAIKAIAGVTSAQFTTSASDFWTCQVATFKAALDTSLIGAAQQPVVWATRIRP